MSVLNDGRFVFTDEKGNLYMESKGDKNSFSLFYGSKALAHAFNEEMGIVALVCPHNDAVLESLHINNDSSRSVLKVYRFDDDNLTELLDEVEIPLASSVLWLKPAYLVVSNPDNLTSIIKFLKGKLKVVVRDRDIYPFVSLKLLGLLSNEPPSVHLWDVDRNKKVDSLTLKNTRGRRGKRKLLRGSCGSGNFAVIANDDGTADVLYIVGNSARVLSPSISLSITRQNPCDESGALAESMRIDPLCVALSSSTVLVGASGGNEILKLKYKKDGSLKIEDIKKLGNGEELAAISKNRCLIRRIDEDNEKKMVFTAFPLPTIRTTSSANVEDSEAGAPDTSATEGHLDTNLTESTKRKRRRRNRKEKYILEGQTPNGSDKRKITNGSYSIYTPRIAIGMLLVSVLIALYLRRR
ncbi:unnamed protein product [Phytomonas sp. EM1]|nr:unnamed protein product [Phytomonas sp. EM1]|eukprot:CCW60860.1 unnamed protein product [Phytomonas sp. isolate EM1]